MRKITKFFAGLWIAALLSSTVGVSVQRIYCYCIGQTSVAFFATSEGGCYLKGHAVDLPCCAKKSTSQYSGCCKKKEASAETQRGCTKKTTQVFQLRTEFLVDKPFEKSFDWPAWSDEIHVFKYLSCEMWCGVCLPNKPPPGSPPLSGRTICLRHQLFLC